MATTEEALRRWVERPRALLVGLGGAGTETVSDIEGPGLPEAIEALAINTDGHHLYSQNVSQKLLLGEMELHGRGSGGDRAAVANLLAKEKDRLVSVFRPYHLVFLFAGLGGGTGSALLPFCTAACREAGALPIPVAMLPFEVELESNPTRRENAQATLREMIAAGGFFVVLSNEKLRRFESQPIKSVFQMRSTYLRQLTLSLMDMIEHPSEINVDLALVRHLIEEAGLSTLMVAQGHMGDPEALLHQAVQESFLDFEINEPGPVLLHVEGGSNLSLRTHHRILETFRAGLKHPRHFVFGTRIMNNPSDGVRVTVIVGKLKAATVTRLVQPSGARQG